MISGYAEAVMANRDTDEALELLGAEPGNHDLWYYFMNSEGSWDHVDDYIWSNAS